MTDQPKSNINNARAVETFLYAKNRASTPPTGSCWRDQVGKRLRSATANPSSA